MSPVELAQVSDLHRIKDLVGSCKLSTEHIETAGVWLVKRLDSQSLVGCMALERRANRVHIQSLSVAKNHRKQGIARELINFAYENYLSFGDCLVALTLFWNNAFYEKVGFHRVNAAEIKRADDVGSRKKHRHCVAFVKEKL